MQLIENWRAELSRLWSTRLAILGILLASADQILAALSGAGILSPLEYSLLYLAIIVARLVQQKNATAQ